MRAIFCSILLNIYLLPSVLTSSGSRDGVFFVGQFSAVFTPFDDNMELNLDVIPEYACFLSENNVKGVLVAGTAGEGPTLNLKERKKLVCAWRNAAKSYNMQVIMQVGGGLTVADIKELARYCEEIGVDGIMTLPELYYRPTNIKKLVKFVKDIAAMAPKTPIFYYDNPEFSGVALDMVKFWKKATQSIDTFTGLKCPTKTGISILANVYFKENQSLLPTSNLGIVPSLASGMNGTISTVANVYPKLVSSMARDTRNGDWASAMEKQYKINRLIWVILRGLGETALSVSWYKTAMELETGIKFGSVRDSLPKTTPERRRKMAQDLISEGSDVVVLYK